MIERFFSDSKTKSVVLLLLLSLLVGSILLYYKVGVRPKAAPGVPSLNFSIEPGLVNSAENFDLVLKVNPNNASFYAFELYAGFDPSKVEFQDNVNLAQNITSSYPLITKSVDTNSNIITLIGTRTGSSFSGTVNQEIARVKMKVKSGVSGDMIFSWANNTKLGSNLPIEKVNGTFSIGGTTGAILSVDIPSVINSTAQRGQNVDTQLLLTTNNNQVKALDFILPYDDTRLTFQNTVDLAQNIVINPNSGFDTQFVIKSVNPSTKRISLGLQAQTPVQSSTDILLATIKFVVKLDAPDGLTDLMPDSASTVYNLQTQNILECTGGYHLLVGQVITPTPGGPTDTPTPTITPGGPTLTPTITPTPPIGATSTPTPTPNPFQMNLGSKVRFQGILGLPNQAQPLSVKVTINSIALSVAQTAVGDFTVDNNGFWSGRVGFNNVSPSSDYKIFIKGPKHLQKRICQSTPQESSPGTYHCENGAILLNYGDNNLDFSGIFLLVGDLPVQDGVVNSYDISLIRNNIGSTDPSVLALADLNLDGIVDSQDYSLVIAALSVRTDEGL
ncbi:hypothetical protein A3F58_00545 [Candidatus Roizmanbacteria bacterium RIFCSPHIGHO2_12_FULL_37_9b]|nr:MAG: hypothetical protein A3F58_00545 [Candidatus Roizmanbacteria bacterium RIFCSPHIGHO2_12_FULL_37_9b]